MMPLTDEAGFDPARLNRDYNARETVSPERFAHAMTRYRQQSDLLRAPWLRHGDVVYDPESGQVLDIFGPAAGPRDAPCPVFIFIHGGYWRALSKRDSAMMAGMLAARGIASVIVDYTLAPQATLDEIVRQVRAAVAFVWHHGRGHGLDPDRICIGGSSAGGHLTGAVLAQGWHDDFRVPADLIKFAMPVSGLFELAPIAATFPQEWLQLDADAVARLSPLRHVPVNGCPITVAWAQHEAPGFLRQSMAYATSWRAAGGRATLLQIPECNHFDILLDWADAESALSRALLSGIREACGMARAIDPA